jgi:hypothetical protein
MKPYLHNHVLNVHHGDKMLAHTGNHILGQTDGECLCMYGLWKFIKIIQRLETPHIL